MRELTHLRSVSLDAISPYKPSAVQSYGITHIPRRCECWAALHTKIYATVHEACHLYDTFALPSELQILRLHADLVNL
jgi:hypothetical protein